jgi:two-component system sensor histidine kinase/response regulator
MQGRIHVESTVGSGSRFSFTARFGLASRVPEPARAADSPSGEAPQPLRVLLAEDNVFNQTVVTAFLEGAGHEVTVVENGEQAVASGLDGDYDLILMDVEMPCLDGLSATNEIRAKEESLGRHVPILAMTAHAHGEDRERCLQAGMDGYLAKPVRVRQLTNAIQAVLTGASPVDAPLKDPITTEESESIDWSAALEAVGGNAELLRLAVDTALEECPRSLSEIRRAIDRGESATLRIAAHSLKGTLRHFGATRAFDAAYRLEVMARDRDLECAAEILTELADQMARLQTALVDFRETGEKSRP